MSQDKKRFVDMIRGQVGSLPDDYYMRQQTLRDLHDAAREVCAESFAEALNARATNMPQINFREKQTVADWVNHELRPLGLAVCDPKTGQAALLKARQGRDQQMHGEYYFEVTDSDGVRHSRPTIGKGYPELPTLKLMPAELDKLSHVEHSILRHK